MLVSGESLHYKILAVMMPQEALYGSVIVPEILKEEVVLEDT